MSKLFFNELEITSNEQFIICSKQFESNSPIPIKIFHGKLLYHAVWNYIDIIKFLDNHTLETTIEMQNLSIEESEEVDSDYNVEIVNIVPHQLEHYTTVTLKLQNKINYYNIKLTEKEKTDLYMSIYDVDVYLKDTLKVNIAPLKDLFFKLQKMN